MLRSGLRSGNRRPASDCNDECDHTRPRPAPPGAPTPARPGADIVVCRRPAPASAEQRPSDARSGPDPELRKILIAAVAEADSFTDRFDAEVWLTDMSHR